VRERWRERERDLAEEPVGVRDPLDRVFDLPCRFGFQGVGRRVEGVGFGVRVQGVGCGV